MTPTRTPTATKAGVKPRSGGVTTLSCTNDSVVITPSPSDHIGNAEQLVEALTDANNGYNAFGDICYPYNIFLQGGTYDLSGDEVYLPDAINNYRSVIIHGADASSNRATLKVSTSHLLNIQALAIVELHYVLMTNNGEHDGRFAGGAITNAGTLSVFDSVIDNNAAEHEAGAILNWGTLDLTRTVVSNNTASAGGAIRNTGGTLTATCSSFLNNTAAWHGALLQVQNTTMTITKSKFVGNHASSGEGGAIGAWPGTTVTATNNWWGASGGIPVNTSGPGTDTVYGNVIVEPVAEEDPISELEECEAQAPEPTPTPSPTPSPTPTLTPTPRPTLTLTPTASWACTIRLDAPKYAFVEVYQTTPQPSATPPQTPSSPTSSWILIPANTEVDVYLRYLRSDKNIVEIDYDGDRYWMDTSYDVTAIDGNCDGFIIAPTIPPTYVGTPPIQPSPLQIILKDTVTGVEAPCNPSAVPYEGRTPNGRFVGTINCQYIGTALSQIQQTSSDFLELSRILWLAQRGDGSTLTDNFYELKVRIESFFCVQLGDIGSGNSRLSYQNLVDIFLALFQTSNAFLRTDPSLGTIHGAACAVFQTGTNKLHILRVDDVSDGAETKVINGVITIELYNNSQVSHDPQTIVHEIGHVVNIRLKGSPANYTPNSPLGRLLAGQLVDAQANAISYIGPNNTWVRGPGLGVGDPWNKNLGNSCPDYICRANEEFADMFLNWVYDVPNNNVFAASAQGQGRRTFMNTRMKNNNNQSGYGWIDCLFDNALSFCP